MATKARWDARFRGLAMTTLLLATASLADTRSRLVPDQADGVVAEPTTEDGRAVVTFSGLRTYDDGSSTLRINVSRVVPVQQTASGKKLSFLLSGARVQLRTNKYPLHAEYFGSNVLRTKLSDGKGGVRVDIDLRKAVNPEHEVLRHAGGAIVRIDIPPGG